MPPSSSLRPNRKRPRKPSFAGLLAERRSPTGIPGADVFEKLGYTPTPKQEQFHAATEYSVLYGGAAGEGQLLRIDEPIPTPAGWTTMGELRPGDQVFTEHGIPCAVLCGFAVEAPSPPPTG